MRELEPHPDTTHDLDRLTGPGVRAFFSIASRWCLSDREQMNLLGLPGPLVLEDWRSGECQDIDQGAVERISLILGIYKAINTLLPVPERADGWMRASNDALPFGGRSPLELMASGDVADLQAVRRYLDAQCN